MLDSRKIWACIYRRFDHMWTQRNVTIRDTIEFFSSGTQIALADLYAGTGRIIAAS